MRDMNETSEYRQGLLCAVASIILVSIAQLAMKYGMSHAIHIDPAQLRSLADAGNQLIHLSLTTVLLPIAAGIFCYALSVLCWMAALGRLPLNLAYPLLSLSYPLVYLGAALLPFFSEALNMQRLAGIGLIMLGVVFLMLNSGTTENRR